MKVISKIFSNNLYHCEAQRAVMDFLKNVLPISVKASKFGKIKPSFVCKTLNEYRKVASSSPSRIEAHAGLFRLLMKGIFDPYVL